MRVYAPLYCIDHRQHVYYSRGVFVIALKLTFYNDIERLIKAAHTKSGKTCYTTLAARKIEASLSSAVR